MSWATTLKLLLVLVLIFCVDGRFSWSDEQSDLILQMKQQMERMQQRLDTLEKRNNELESRLEKQESKTEQQEQAVEDVQHVVAHTATNGINSSMPIDFYGYLKFDASYDTARTDAGNFARWVPSEALNHDDDQFNATANQSRFGLNFHGPDFGSAQTGGRVEVDFYGGGAENKAHIMMRHAYAQIDWPDNDFSLLAGQTSDVISPLVPPTVNYPVGWWAGNIGYRRPQLQIRKGFSFENDTCLYLQGALARTIGDSNLFGPGDTGEDAGFPTLQGRLAYEFPLLTGQKTIVGISGHWGEEEYDITNTGTNRTFDTWSLNVDVTLPLLEILTLTGEYFMGENLDAYLGGIAQGIHHIDRDGNAANGNEFPLEGVSSYGGWAALGIGPFGDFMYHAGASIDNPDNGDLNVGGRSQNMSVFANTFYSINRALLLGYEISYWDTEYVGMDEGDSFRMQASVMYKF